MLGEQDIRDLEAKYSIGDAVTFEQMQKIKSNEQEFSLQNPFERETEKNPYVFEDKPVGFRHYALLNIVGPGMPQQHEGGKTLLKVKATTATAEDGRLLAESLHSKDNTYGIYVNEMFKFVVVPPPAVDATDPDGMLNEAIKNEYTTMEDRSQAFSDRKTQMLEDIERQNDITRRIAEGELDESERDSACKFPENTNEQKLQEPTVTASMEPDPFLGRDRYVVLATLKLTRDGPLKDHVVLKLCGSFETEELANDRMTTLKKDLKYKLFDVCVCDMSSWLEIPPPYELIENVRYDNTKLTEALGARKQQVNITSNEICEPRDDVSMPLA